MTINQLQIANQLSGKLSADKISIPSLRKLIKLQKTITEHLDAHTTAQTALFKGYDIEQKDGMFTWNDHDKQEEITAKLTELNAVKYQIDGNFMNETEFFSATQQTCKVNEIASLYDVLVVIDTNVPVEVLAE